MNKWLTFKYNIDDLLNQSDAYKIKKKWQDIKKKLNGYVPDHLISFFKSIEKYKNKKINILDHGCGGGLTVFILVLNGYNNVWGVDISNTKNFMKRSAKINKILSILTKSKSKKILSYDGKKIPFRSHFFDLIFSQQVLEHVEDNLLKYYLSEEKRTLKDNGMIFHQIPHRLGPYEGHTKKWCIHWLPKNLHCFLLKKDPQSLDLVKNYLFLRWPWALKKEFKKYFIEVTNITFYRLKYDIYSSEFSLKEKLARKFLVKIFKIPYLGVYLSKLLSIFFQLEVIAKKKD